MNMLFSINTSPFFGKDGKFVTSRHLRDRLYKEMEKNPALEGYRNRVAGFVPGLWSWYPSLISAY